MPMIGICRKNYRIYDVKWCFQINSLVGLLVTIVLVFNPFSNNILFFIKILKEDLMEYLIEDFELMNITRFQRTSNIDRYYWNPHLSGRLEL